MKIEQLLIGGKQLVSRGGIDQLESIYFHDVLILERVAVVLNTGVTLVSTLFL